MHVQRPFGGLSGRHSKVSHGHFGVILGPFWGHRGTSTGILGPYCGFQNIFWTMSCNTTKITLFYNFPICVQSCRGSCRCHFGGILVVSEGLFCHFRVHWGVLGSLGITSGLLSGCADRFLFSDISWGQMGDFGAILGACHGILGPLGTIFGPSCVMLGPFLCLLGGR